MEEEAAVPDSLQGDKALHLPGVFLGRNAALKTAADKGRLWSHSGVRVIVP